MLRNSSTIRKLDYLIQGHEQPFIVKTDNQALTWLKTLRRPSNKVKHKQTQAKAGEQTGRSLDKYDG